VLEAHGKVFITVHTFKTGEDRAHMYEGTTSNSPNHAHVRNELVCLTLKEKCLAASMRVVGGAMEEMDEA
jgi:hypothetical protein